VQVTYKRCHASGGVDASDLDTSAFMPGQPGICALSTVPEDPSILDHANVGGADPGKGNIITMDRGPQRKSTQLKISMVQCHSARLTQMPALLQ
jgi:hypothetical protein